MTLFNNGPSEWLRDKLKAFISTTTTLITNKLDRVVTYLEALLPILTQDPLIKWSCRITWKTKSTIFPLQLRQWPINLKGWWITLRASYHNIKSYYRVYSRKIERLGIGRFVKKCPFWKKTFLNLKQTSKKQLPMKRVFDFHVPFFQTNLPFYWDEEQFPKNKFIWFSCFK